MKAEVFKRIRRGSGYQQRVWAQIAGVAPNSISRYESGKNPVPMWMVQLALMVKENHEAMDRFIEVAEKEGSQR